MRVAVISDIHGNRLALEAVLEDIARVGVDLTVNLGDLLAGPIDPAGTAAILRDLDLPTVSGNHERTMCAAVASDPVDRWAAAQLTPADLTWLSGFPPTLQLGELFFCHGTPQSDSEAWLDTWFTGRTSVLPDEAAVSGPAMGIDAAVMLCGHTHRPRAVRLSDGRLIVNPGSVGLQLFYGSPDAQYAVLEQGSRGWAVTQHMVPYDHVGAAGLAKANGFAHWHPALATGWAAAHGLFGG